MEIKVFKILGAKSQNRFKMHELIKWFEPTQNAWCKFFQKPSWIKKIWEYTWDKNLVIWMNWIKMHDMKNDSWVKMQENIIEVYERNAW
jgi:hypothetical protein